MPLHFSCTMCGRCCRDLRVPLGLSGALDWLRDGGEVQLLCEAVPWLVEPAADDLAAAYKFRRSFAAPSGTLPLRVVVTVVAAFEGPCPPSATRSGMRHLRAAAARMPHLSGRDQSVHRTSPRWKGMSTGCVERSSSCAGSVGSIRGAVACGRYRRFSRRGRGRCWCETDAVYRPWREFDCARQRGVRCRVGGTRGDVAGDRDRNRQDRSHRRQGVCGIVDHRFESPPVA